MRGNMNGCGNTLPGPSGGDRICQNRYDNDVNSSRRDRILDEYGTEPEHKALLAVSVRHPEDIELRNKTMRALAKPNQDIIAPGWSEFFQFNGVMMESLSSDFTNVNPVWIGLSGNVMDGFTISGTNCNDWGGGGNGRIGNPGAINNRRLNMGYTGCSPSGAASINLICITH